MLISQWFKISFLNKNLKLISLTLMYEITLGCLLSSKVNHANITQDRWWKTSIIFSSFLCLIVTHSWVNWVCSYFSELLSFLAMLITIESVFSERTVVAIHLMLTFAVDTFEWIRVWFFFKVLSLGWLVLKFIL